MPNMLNYAFTQQYQGRSNKIITPIAVSKAGNFKNNATPIEYSALWDTGATSTTISEKIVNDLNLVAHDQVSLMTANGSALKDVYYVNIVLPNNVMISSLRVVNVDLTDDPNNKIDALIGMDIISQSDFAITNVKGLTTVSFMIPSHEKIDFVPIAEKLNMQMFGNRK